MGDPITRPPVEEMYLQMAEVIAQRSTCQRKKVGCLITNAEGTTVWAIGYNGNHRGAANACDQPEVEGQCGCVHAETNALIKAPYDRGPLVLYCTRSPCSACAKLICNSKVTRVVFRIMRDDHPPLALLHHAGVAFDYLPYARCA